jgi:nucleoside 2-deoxyribosyltransferase
MKILISHDSARDGEFAFRLADALRERNADPRMENLKAACGENNFDCLKRELSTRYDHVIPVLSDTYLRDQFLVDEFWAAAFLDERKPQFLLPAMISDHRMPLRKELRERVTDFRGVPFKDAFHTLTTPLSKHRQVFVIMPDSDPPLKRVYDEVIQPVIEQAGFAPKKIDGPRDSEFITLEVVREIDRSPVVFADLTGQRPSCYLELGYALAKEKHVIVAVHGNEILQFHIDSSSFIRWSDSEKLRGELLVRLLDVSERLSIVPEAPKAEAKVQKAS